jgi:predicted dehydrogenase
MTSGIGWGILGASSFARRRMAPAMALASGQRLVAVASRDPSRVGGFADAAPDVRAHGSYQALLADREVDAVYVPLPHVMHVEWALKAMEAGKPVLVEKPLAMSAPAIDTLIEMRDRTGLACAEAYMIVHHPQWHRARALLAEGAIGRLRHVEAAFCYNNAADGGNIRNMAEMGGGALPDIGVYAIGSTRFVTGAEPTEVRARIEWEAGCDVLSEVDARFDGFTARWTVSMRMAPWQHVHLHGEAGTLRLTAPFNAGAFGEARLELRRGGALTVERWPEVNQYVLQLEAFAAAVRGEAAFPWTLEDARGTQAVIDAAYASAGGRPSA